MTHFRVDLRTKIIGAETNVYLARAGQNGHLFQQVLAEMAIGPDLPNLGLDLSNGLERDADVEAKVKRARALRSWLRAPSTSRGQEPSRNLNDYKGANKRPGHAQIEGIVKSYFHELKGGDVLVVPNPSYFDEAIIAEALPLEGVASRIPGTRRFEGYNFDGRRFGHFTRVKMAALPRSVIDLAQAPTGFAKIVNPAVKRRIFELAYSDYALDDQFTSRIVTTKGDFTPFDGNVLNALVTMVATNVERLQHGAADTHLVGLVQAVFMDVGDDDLQVKININSPGHIAIFDRSIVPLVTTAVLAILVAAGFDSAAIAQNATVEVTNSRVDQALDLCSQEVQRLTQSMLQFLPEKEFQETCALLKKTHESTGASSGVAVKKE